MQHVYVKFQNKQNDSYVLIVHEKTWKTRLIVTWHIVLPSIPPLWHPWDKLAIDPSIPRGVTLLLNGPLWWWWKLLRRLCIVDWVTRWGLQALASGISRCAYCLYPGDRFLLTGPATLPPSEDCCLASIRSVMGRGLRYHTQYNIRCAVFTLSW